MISEQPYTPTEKDRMSPLQSSDTLATPEAPATGQDAIPGVFMMIDSLQTGGSERQFASLARSLDRSAFHVHLGCIQQRGGFRDGLGEMAHFPLRGSLYGWQSLKSRLRLARHLRRCDVAIAHAFDFYTNLTLVPSARLSRVPVVIGSQRQIGDLLTHAQARAQMAAFRWCDRVVCNSRAAGERLVSQGLRRDKVVVIGNGLPPEAFAECPPALPRSPGVLRVGMIARMNLRAKNHLTFLRVAARLQKRYPALEVLLVGDGPLRPEFELEAARLGLGERVSFLGDRRDIPAVLASMDVSVLPSASESLSNVVLESMAAGVPVIATRVGGNVELIAEGRGALVPPGDEEALAASMDHLLQNSALRAKWGDNGRRFALENFTLERMRKSHDCLYTQLLDEKGWFKQRNRKQPARQRTTASEQKPLRVAIVAASMRYVGGHSVQADLLVRSWQRDPAVETCLIPVDPAFPRMLAWIEGIPFLRTVVRQPVYMASLWRAFKQADIAHIFSASYWSFLVAPAPAWLIARIRGVKALINYHSGEARDHLRRSRVAKAILRRTDRLIVPSQYLVDVFGEFGLEAKAVPNIVDLEQFSFRVRKPLRPRLICTRGFHRYYSVDVVVRAFAGVKRIHPDATLCLVGGGDEEKSIRDLVRELRLEEDVNFTGVASRQEIGRLYDQADVFVNASWLDNMPISILEAFACGTPVATTGPEGIKYLVEHERTGLLSEPGDWRALAANVIRLLGDGDLASRIATNAYEESKRYRWELVREQWLDVYESLRRVQLPAHAVRLTELPEEPAGGRTGASAPKTQEDIASSRV
ncbi:MAG TPA: glycosyltransferase [Terriglobia bacterium]|nr:glycosyltransferase [Terriglobia bacterium]